LIAICSKWLDRRAAEEEAIVWIALEVLVILDRAVILAKLLVELETKPKAITQERKVSTGRTGKHFRRENRHSPVCE
jgi:hypothetical protein